MQNNGLYIKMKGTISAYKVNNKYFIVASTNTYCDVVFYGKYVSNSTKVFDLIVSIQADNNQMNDMFDIINKNNTSDKRYIFSKDNYSIISKQSILNDTYAIDFFERLISSFSNETLICKIEVNDLIEEFLKYESEIDDMKHDEDVRVLFGLPKFKNRKFETKCVDDIMKEFFDYLPNNRSFDYNQIERAFIVYISRRRDVLITDMKDNIIFKKNYIQDATIIKVTLDGKNINSELYYIKKYDIYILKHDHDIKIVKFNQGISSDIPASKYFAEFLFENKIMIDTLEYFEARYNAYLREKGLPCFLSHLILETDYTKHCIVTFVQDNVYVQSIIDN